MQEEETSILGGRVRVLQPDKGLRVTTDTVLLAAAAKVGLGDTVMDMGCGTGGAGLALLARVSDINLIGIDIQDELITLAQKNAALNDWSDQCRFECRDVTKQPHRDLDHIICNPPYMREKTWSKGVDEARNKALGFDQGTMLKNWIDAIYGALKPMGGMTLIHKAETLDELLIAMHERFGAIEVIPLASKAEEPAKRIIIRAIKGRKTPLTIHPTIILHKSDGDYTESLKDILMNVASLS